MRPILWKLLTLAYYLGFMLCRRYAARKRDRTSFAQGYERGVEAANDRVSARVAQLEELHLANTAARMALGEIIGLVLVEEQRLRQLHNPAPGYPVGAALGAAPWRSGTVLAEVRQVASGCLYEASRLGRVDVLQTGPANTGPANTAKYPEVERGQVDADAEVELGQVDADDPGGLAVPSVPGGTDRPGGSR